MNQRSRNNTIQHSIRQGGTKTWHIHAYSTSFWATLYLLHQTHLLVLQTQCTLIY